MCIRDSLKSPVARRSGRIARLDLRNNLVLLRRWFAQPLRDELWSDWLERYSALLRHHVGASDACAADVSACVSDALDYAGDDPPAEVRRPLTDPAVESLLGFDAIEQSLDAWRSRLGVGRVVLAGYTKTLYPVWRACDRLGIDVVAVADDGPAFVGQSYRGVPVLGLDASEGLGIDGWVVADRNPARAPGLQRLLAARGRPVWALAEPGADAPAA